MWAVVALAAAVSARAEVRYDRDIRPLLSDRCFKCHGPDEKQRQARLRLDTREGLLGDAGLVTPGQPKVSELVARINTTDPDDLMPPPDSKLTLSESERRLIAQWIAEGANYRQHWSFEPPRMPELRIAAGGHPIDALVEEELRRRGLVFSPRASREVLIRRLSLDLTGLPPTLAEMDSFLRDTSPRAYDALVGRLLASERFGERMASYWLDAARYADTSGYLYDWPRTMWPWRDWVIRAFNENLPLDDFVRWQIAGDLFPNATSDQIIATGFNRNHGYTIEEGIIDEEYRTAYVNDRVTTVGTVFLGLTLECARCHNHKYDPITQREFYQLFAFFNQVPEAGVQPNQATFSAPAVGIPSPEQLEEIERLERAVEELEFRLQRPDARVDARQSELERQVGSIWSPLAPLTAQSVGGAAFSLLPDGSVRATGANPVNDQYTITVSNHVDGVLSAVRLEALADPGLNRGGPGRSAEGNAFLGFIGAVHIDAEGKRTALPFDRASGDREVPGFAAEGATDSAPRTGWAMPSNDGRSPCAAVFEFERAPEVRAGDRLEFQLIFNAPFPQHTLGRVRFSVTINASPSRIDPTGTVAWLATRPAATRSPREAAAVRAFCRATLVPAYRDIYAQIVAHDRRRRTVRGEIPSLMIMSDGLSRETRVLERGRYDRPREVVRPDTPAVLPPFPAGAPRNRLGLAHWLTAPENPLVARVLVNQIWSQLFGRGIVKTVDDFGVQGEPPTHPELLDWLALDFVRNGWNLKHLVGLIVSSATYQQSSIANAGAWDADPENRWLARGARFRLPAEMIRDSALTVSGLLQERIGGRSVKPYQPAGLWESLTRHPKFQQTYVPDAGADLYRRSLYTFWKRALPHPAMAAFDAPNRQVCTVSRRQTTTPQQALVMLHETGFIEAARALAARSLREGAFGKTTESRIATAFRVVTSRAPDASELAVLTRLHASEAAKFQRAPDEAHAMLAVGQAPLPADVQGVDLAAMTMVCRAILNLSESITRP